MYEMKYPNLFKPLQLGKTVLRNRIIASPTGIMHLDAGGQFPPEAIAYYEQKARGGAALVHVSECYVDRKRGCDISEAVFLDNDSCIPNIAEIADAISKYGAVPSLELQHAGMYASASYLNGNQIYAPVETEVVGTKAGAELNGIVLPEMPEEIILEIIEQYADAAERAKKAGFKMVLVHGGHGWLLNQFISPSMNTRTDQWGGNTENRMRLAVSICDRIKEKCGKDFLIEFRMSADDLAPDGYRLDEGIEIAKAIDGHCDVIHVSVGLHERIESFVVMHPSMFLEDGCNRNYAVEIKKHVNTPVCTVGAFSDPRLMESMIASGQVDLIAVARGLIADPDLPNKARAGKDEEINPCLRCYTCFSNLIATHQYSCAINPVIGRIIENKYDTVPVKSRKVLIAGGGIGGMEAALTAAERGHQVILFEKTDKLGGILRCESQVAFKKKLDIYLNNQAERVMKHPNIEVRINTPATAEAANEIAPDAIISAVGARPVVPTFIKGYDRSNVVSAEEVYYDMNKAGEKVVLIGGGLVGCELAIHLAQNGRTVSIFEMLPMFNFGNNMIHGQAIGEQIAMLNIDLHTSTRVLEINGQGVVIEDPEGISEYQADTVIYAVGQKPVTEVTESLRFCAPEFYSIGDCNVPANIQQATKEAYYAARNIGRI